MKQANLNNLRDLYFFDSHTHLQEPEIVWDIDEMLLRWEQNSGGTIVCCGTKESDWQAVENIALKYNNVIPSFGVHPWFVEGVSEKWFYELDRHLDAKINNEKSPKPFIGEIGLDNVIKNTDKKMQERIFKIQIGMAKERNIPVSIHIRKGWDILFRTLKTIGHLKRGGVIHSYSGSADLISTLERYGLYISFSGSVTHPNNKKVQKSLKAVSPHRLLIETDSPAILPHYSESSIIPPHQNKKSDIPEHENIKWATKLFQIGLNEPCNIFMVATSVSRLLEIPLSEVARITTLNGEELFLR